MSSAHGPSGFSAPRAAIGPGAGAFSRAPSRPSNALRRAWPHEAGLGSAEGPRATSAEPARRKPWRPLWGRADGRRAEIEGVRAPQVQRPLRRLEPAGVVFTDDGAPEPSRTCVREGPRDQAADLAAKAARWGGLSGSSDDESSRAIAKARAIEREGARAHLAPSFSASAQALLSESRREERGRPRSERLEGAQASSEALGSVSEGEWSTGWASSVASQSSQRAFALSSAATRARRLEPAGDIFAEEALEARARERATVYGQGAAPPSASAQPSARQALRCLEPAGDVFEDAPRATGAAEAPEVEARGALRAQPGLPFDHGGKAREREERGSSTSASSGEALDSRTTVMLQRIDYSLDEAGVCEILDRAGFARTYDAVYVPRNSRRKSMNLAYAFVNFLRPSCAAACIELCNGRPFGDGDPTKLCHAAYSNQQGPAFMAQRIADTLRKKQPGEALATGGAPAAPGRPLRRGL